MVIIRESLINCKIHLELNCTKKLSDVYVLIVTLSTIYNVKSTKKLSRGFKKYVYWNQYKTVIE